MTPDPKMAALAQLLLSSGRLQEGMDCHDAAGELAALRARLAEAEAQRIGMESCLHQAEAEADRLTAQRDDLAAENARLRTDPPWLADLTTALGWQGGTVHQAIEAVRQVTAEAARLRASIEEAKTVCHAKAYWSVAEILHAALCPAPGGQP